MFTEPKLFVAVSGYVVVFRHSVHEWCLLTLPYEQEPKVHRVSELSLSQSKSHRKFYSKQPHFVMKSKILFY
jgi:hypothetical protein